MLRKSISKEELARTVGRALTPRQLRFVAGGTSLPNLSSVSPDTWAAIAQHDANQVPKVHAAE
jgi:hypothetical protein